MAAKKTTGKKKAKKNVPVGRCYIRAGFGNTVVTMTDPTGGTVCWSSAGLLGFKGSRKGTPFAAQMAAEDAAKKVLIPSEEVESTTGSILYEYWMGIGGSSVSDLTSNGNYPGNPSGSSYMGIFEAPVDWAEEYGARYVFVRGDICDPDTVARTMERYQIDGLVNFAQLYKDVCAIIVHPGVIGRKLYSKVEIL